MQAWIGFVFAFQLGVKEPTFHLREHHCGDRGEGAVGHKGVHDIPDGNGHAGLYGQIDLHAAAHQHKGHGQGGMEVGTIAEHQGAVHLYRAKFGGQGIELGASGRLVKRLGWAKLPRMRGATHEGRHAWHGLQTGVRHSPRRPCQGLHLTASIPAQRRGCTARHPGRAARGNRSEGLDRSDRAGEHLEPQEGPHDVDGAGEHLEPQEWPHDVPCALAVVDAVQARPSLVDVPSDGQVERDVTLGCRDAHVGTAVAVSGSMAEAIYAVNCVEHRDGDDLEGRKGTWPDLEGRKGRLQLQM